MLGILQMGLLTIAGRRNWLLAKKLFFALFNCNRFRMRA
jgi:hypothetical protein